MQTQCLKRHGRQKPGSRVLSDVETLKSALEEDPKIVGMLANPAVENGR